MGMIFSEEFKQAIYAEEARLKKELDTINQQLGAMELIRKTWEQEVPAPALPVAAAAPGVQKVKASRQVKTNPRGEAWESKMNNIREWVNQHCCNGETYSNAVVIKAFDGKYPRWDITTALAKLHSEKVIDRGDSSRSRNFTMIKGGLGNATFGIPAKVTKAPTPKELDDEEEPEEELSEHVADVDTDQDDDDDAGVAVSSGPVVATQRFAKVSTFVPIPLKDQGKLNKKKFIELVGHRFVRYRSNRTKVKSPDQFWFLFNSTSMACEDLLAGRNEDWVIS